VHAKWLVSRYVGKFAATRGTGKHWRDCAPNRPAAGKKVGMDMTEHDVILYAKYVAVGNGTLTKTMNDKLMAGDRQVAIGIMNGRIRDLEAGVAIGLGPNVTKEDIDTMVESVREAIAVMQP
jgi:hypothetical protein